MARAEVDWNFEGGRLEGWSQSGNAFANQPTLGNNVVARGRDARFAIQGNYFIGTYENRPNSSTAAGSIQGDAPTGVLTSDLVTLTGSTFSCLLGGGQDYDRVYIALLVKATPENRTRYEVDPRDPDTGRSIPFPKTRLADGEYYIVVRETGRNEEAMRRVSLTTAYIRPGDQARVRIGDTSADGWGHINVDDIRLDARPASSLAGRIHVVDDAGANVPGAEVFVNGEMRGTTDAAGTAAAGLIRSGDRLIARKRLREEGTYRAGHQTGSTQNWKYRVYATSLPVGNDGSANAALAHGDSARSEELRVSRQNVLFGLNVNVSVEWDTSNAEIQQIRRDLRDASAYLYNATDGQFVFEQIDLRSDARGWRDADFRVHADKGVRPHTDIPFGWFDPGLLSPGLMHMPRDTSRWGGPQVYTHEFGHYGFGLFDEYLDIDPNNRCTTVASGTGPFGTGGAQSSCMMWRQWQVSKICSFHPANPHNVLTLQGILHSHDCWQNIVDVYGSPGLSGVNPYVLKSPKTRNAIPGMLPAMPSGWMPRFVEAVGMREGFVGPVTVTIFDGATPREGVSVSLRTREGRVIAQGDTDAAGQIVVLGCHRDDTIGYDGRERNIPAFSGFLASLAPMPQGGQTMRVELKRGAPGIQLGTVWSARDKGLSLQVRARDGKLDDTPTATVAFAPEDKPRPLKVAVDPDLNAYVAVLPEEAPNGAIVSVTGSIGGEKLSVSTSVKVLTSNGEHLDLYTPDGVAVVRIPDGGLAKGVRVVAGSAADPVPASEGRVVGGPYAFTATEALKAASTPTTLSFGFGPGFKANNLGAMRILRLEGRNWVEVPGIVPAPGMGTFAVRVEGLGTYVLVAR